MSAPSWSGPYCHAEDTAGRRLAFDPLAGDRPPTAAVRFVVRWRVTGFANPRKRTFGDGASATAWAKGIAAAKMLAAPADAQGAPLLVADAKPAATRTRPADALGAARPTVPDGGTVEGAPGAPVGNPADAPAPRPTARDAPVPNGATRVGTSGPPAARELTVPEYIEELIVVEQPHWEQSNQERWWLDHLAFVKAAFCYPADDPRCTTGDVAPGAGIAFAHLTARDFDRVLNLRRTTNLRVAHQNRQRAARHARLVGEYEAKFAAWQARTGRKGRRPTPPAPPRIEPATSDGAVLISANTEQGFRTVLSFLFDRAYDAGHFPPGPSPYRLWNPRGTGGRHSARRGPFRHAERDAPELRDYPGLGFVVDLGDALAARGRVLGADLRTGERYRVLPLMAVTCAPRPGELGRVRAEHCDDEAGALTIVPESGGHLKHREPGETRSTPLAHLTASLVAAHVAAGLASPDGTLFLSPTGRRFNPTNFTAGFLRPAVATIAGPGRLWPALPALERVTRYTLRKMGITLWIAYGADTLGAANWSGHTEVELIQSYRGVISGRGRRGAWRGIDAMVEQALLDHPPRGDGRLAVHLREWLDLSV